MSERTFGGYPVDCLRKGWFQLEGEQVIAIVNDLLDALEKAEGSARVEHLQALLLRAADYVGAASDPQSPKVIELRREIDTALAAPAVMLPVERSPAINPIPPSRLTAEASALQGTEASGLVGMGPNLVLRPNPTKSGSAPVGRSPSPIVPAAPDDGTGRKSAYDTTWPDMHKPD